jgi:DNA-binding transcriptional ArsR family regulator
LLQSEGKEAVRKMGTVEARLGEDQRRVEEVLARGFSHRVKIEILAALHEGPASASQLARIIREDPNRLGHHLKALLTDGSIEVAFHVPKGNHNVAYYRPIAPTAITDEEAADMTPEEKQVMAALILQASQAEALAALWAGKLVDDPVHLAWQPITLSERGSKALIEELLESWDRVQEIAAEDVNHRARTGEEGKRMIVATFGYERGRSGPHEPLMDRPSSPD